MLWSIAGTGLVACGSVVVARLETTPLIAHTEALVALAGLCYGSVQIRSE